MLHGLVLRLCVPVVLVGGAISQNLSLPESGNRFGNALGSIDAIQRGRMDLDILTINGGSRDGTPLQSPTGSVSALDLKAPAKAQREYEKGYQCLQRKDLKSAVQHLTKAIALYSSFVAAHNALGTAFLELGQNDKARDEFTRAVALDDHLPNSLLNLGIAQMALKEYPAAEESLRKASTIAPLDLQLSLALAYSEFKNQDYAAVVATANEVHARKHKGAAMVHYFAAGACGAQKNLTEAQHQMELLLSEDPNSPSVGQFRQILEQIKTERSARPVVQHIQLAMATTNTSGVAILPSPEDDSRKAQLALQDLQANHQIAEAEAELDTTPTPGSPTAPTSERGNPDIPIRRDKNDAGYVLRASADEVDVFFSATDHGNSIEDLTAANVVVRDDHRPPEKILAFRNESQLPLRIGLIIDTSDSVKERLSFEQKAGANFVRSVLTDSRDLAFVIGVNNSVLLTQDFTSDWALTSRALNQLAPGGGTALWDAVAFAAEKMANHQDAQHVARVLVVISDGQNNSSNTTLKEAIVSAIKADVAVYTVSTRELTDESSSSMIGDHALRTLADLTGGAAFVPGYLRDLNGSLDEVKKIIRARYLVSYKPAAFDPDGRYRPIEVTAQRDGHYFKVFARKGYYASGTTQPAAR